MSLLLGYSVKKIDCRRFSANGGTL